MPLRCLDPTSATSIHAFDLTLESWRMLEASNRQLRHLRMPCCNAEVTLRQSRKGTKFFAHKAVGECSTAPETEMHLRLKQIGVEIARAHGWDAHTEVAGSSASGECWTADVLATKGKHKVAIEIQWSQQPDEETARRQWRYAESGIRCLWLFRQRRILSLFDVPAARVGGTTEEGFVAFLDLDSDAQALPVAEFLTAAFNKRLKFGIPIGTPADVELRAGPTECWRCHREIEIVTGFDLRVGPHSFGFTVPDLSNHPGVHGTISRHVGPFRPLSAVKVRPSRTQGRSYLSNGCSHCNAIFGQFYEHAAREQERVAKCFSVTIDDKWLRLVRDCDYELNRWAVF